MLPVLPVQAASHMSWPDPACPPVHALGKAGTQLIRGWVGVLAVGVEKHNKWAQLRVQHLICNNIEVSNNNSFTLIIYKKKTNCYIEHAFSSLQVAATPGRKPCAAN